MPYKNKPLRSDTRRLRLTPLALAMGLAVMPIHAWDQAQGGEAWQMAMRDRLAPRAAEAPVRAPVHLAGTGTIRPVTSCADDGSAGTLRSVLGEAVSGDTVDLSGLTCSVITLEQGVLDVGYFGDNPLIHLDIVGPGREQLAIDAGGDSQVLTAQFIGGDANIALMRISDLSIRNGRYTGGMASCINGNGEIVLTRVDVSDCHTTGGGPTFASAIAARFLDLNDSTVTGSTGSTTGPGDSRVVLGTIYARSGAELVDSTISGNTIASESSGYGLYYLTAGAGLYARGDVSISGSTISGNIASTADAGQGAAGGGLFATGNVVILDSTIDGNEVDGSGGGVFKAPFSPWGDPPEGTTLTIGNSTVSGNSAGLGGGVSSARPTTLHNTTIAGNHGQDGAGGVLFNMLLDDDLAFEFQSTLVATNTTGDDAEPADLGSTGVLTVTGANNLIVDAGDLDLPGDTIADDPLLQPLADNGGPTWTHALAEGSPAIDAGNNAADLEFDQRGEGFPRVLGEAADIGAFEAEFDVKNDIIFQGGFEMTYLHDDGTGETNQGPPSTFDPDMLWGNYFLTEPGGEVITEIAVAFGPTFPSLADGPVTFWLLDDPDMDFDPRNATALTSVTGTPDVFNNNFFTVQIPPTQVSGAFFVGASAKLLGGQDAPARVDTSHAGDRSWFFYAPEIADVIDDLASAPFGTRMDNPEFVIFPGAFMIRARGLPAD